jgi:asparagine synthase (glutamine-hydrolysing)
MCGILFVQSPTKSEIKPILDSRSELIRRGPERSRVIINKIGLYSFHRLCINDISMDGDQPMLKQEYDNDGHPIRTIILMCNGEIYNCADLIKEHNLTVGSNSDCEVILQLYLKYGMVETYKLLYGVFAFILTDNNIVYYGRDRIGVRPLFMSTVTSGSPSANASGKPRIALASVPHSLLHWSQYISEVEPGRLYSYDCEKDTSNGFCIDILYTYPYSFVDSKADLALEQSWPFVLKELLTEAVKVRLISDRPIACLLSGGLDSSIVTAILVKLLGPRNVRTYSIGLPGSTDLHYARIVADYLGVVHTEVNFSVEEGCDAIPEVIRTLGTYDITTIRASVGMYLLGQYISKHSTDKVIFSGEGSDEIFCGYLYFHQAPTPEDAAEESKRLVRELYKYDVLRADRCISCHGLELREPFLDRKVVDFALSLPGKAKVPTEIGIPGSEKYEKFLLRKAFEGMLPNEIIWRRKEGFSDGVSSLNKPWYSHIQDHVQQHLPPEIVDYTAHSIEAFYYKLVFRHYYPNYHLDIPYWLPKWSKTTDPSGRLMPSFSSASNKAEKKETE